MTKDEFALIKIYMETAYQSQRWEVSVAVWFDFLKNFNYRITLEAVKKYIGLNKFPPTVSDIVKGYDLLLDDISQLPLDNIILKMRADGYFNTPFNEPLDIIDNRMYKANKWLYTGIIPAWFLRDYNRYKNKELKGSEQLAIS